MKLIIFDLDQTLVNFIAIHDKVRQRLFKKIDTDAKLTEIDFAGKSFKDNFRELVKLKKIPENVFQEKSHRLLESYETIFGFPQNVIFL